MPSALRVYECVCEYNCVMGGAVVGYLGSGFSGATTDLKSS